MDSKYDAEEYLDALVALELAAMLAQKDKRPVNRTIRECWSVLGPRVGNNLNRQIFGGVVIRTLPHGALCMLRRQSDAAVSE